MPVGVAGPTGSGSVDPIVRRLAHVTYAAAAVAESKHSLRDAVTQARLVGATWTQIAEVLGISQQAASDKFADTTAEGPTSAQGPGPPLP
jgi:hypothetical protein